MSPYIHDARFMMWDVDGSVGKGGRNAYVDVCYLQWYYTLAAKRPEVPEERKAIYRKVSVTGSCTGREDDPLVQAILAHQRRLNHPYLDGRVDPVPGYSGSYRVGNQKAHFVIRIGARFATMFPEKWPRLDLIPGCPASVAEVSRNAVPTLF